MEPTRTRTERDRAAAEARSRPSTQFASQYPSYPEQAQQLRRPPQQAPAARPQFTDLLERPAPPSAPPARQQQRVAAPPVARAVPQRTGLTAVRRILGLVTFAVLTGMSVPLHILAIFFMYVQIESPGDLASAAPLLAGMFVAVFAVLLVVGVLTQLVGGFPGRWRARVVLALLSGVIAIGIAYVAAITQF